MRWADYRRRGENIVVRPRIALGSRGRTCTFLTLLLLIATLAPEARAQQQGQIARLGFLGSLLESRDEGTDEGVEAAWAAEIAKRIHALDSGAVTPIPWPEARRTILGR
jgi:hypothetical protein